MQKKSFVKHSMENYIINSNIRFREKYEKKIQGESIKMKICKYRLHTRERCAKNFRNFCEAHKIFAWHSLPLNLQEFWLIFSPLESFHTHTHTKGIREHTSQSIALHSHPVQWMCDVRTYEHIWYCFCGSFALIIEKRCVYSFVRTARTTKHQRSANIKIIDINHKLISAWTGRRVREREREKNVKNIFHWWTKYRETKTTVLKSILGFSSNFWHVKCKCKWIQFHRVTSNDYWKKACVPKKENIHCDYTLKIYFRRIYFRVCVKIGAIDIN